MQTIGETDTHLEPTDEDDPRIRWWHYLIYYPGPYRYDDYEDRTQMRWWDFVICIVCHLGIIGLYIYVSAHLGIRSEEGVSLYLILALVVVILFFVNRFILRLYLDRVRDIPLGGVLAPFVDWRKSVTVDSIKKYKHSSRKEAIKSIFKPSFWLSSETVGALMVFSIVAIGINQATYQWYTPEASSSSLLVPGPVTVQCSDDGHRLTVNWVQRAGGISPSGYRVRETLSSRNIRSADQQLTQTVSREATSVTFDASPGSTYEI